MKWKLKENTWLNTISEGRGDGVAEGIIYAIKILIILHAVINIIFKKCGFL